MTAAVLGSLRSCLGLLELSGEFGSSLAMVTPLRPIMRSRWAAYCSGRVSPPVPFRPTTKPIPETSVLVLPTMRASAPMVPRSWEGISRTTVGAVMRALGTGFFFFINRQPGSTLLDTTINITRQSVVMDDRVRKGRVDWVAWVSVKGCPSCSIGCCGVVTWDAFGPSGLGDFWTVFDVLSRCRCVSIRTEVGSVCTGSILSGDLFDQQFGGLVGGQCGKLFAARFGDKGGCLVFVLSLDCCWIGHQ